MANPVGTILSAAMMLRWLGQRHGDGAATAAAARIERAVQQVLASPANGTPDLGGTMTTGELGQAIIAAMQSG